MGEASEGAFTGLGGTSVEKKQQKKNLCKHHLRGEVDDTDGYRLKASGSYRIQFIFFYWALCKEMKYKVSNKIVSLYLFKGKKKSYETHR